MSVRSLTIWQDTSPGARPTKGISIEFEIQSKYGVLWFKVFSTNHHEILHTPRQCYCRDVCKMSWWSIEYAANKSITNFIEFRFRTKNRYWDGRQDSSSGNGCQALYPISALLNRVRDSLCRDYVNLWTLWFLCYTDPAWLSLTNERKFVD